MPATSGSTCGLCGQAAGRAGNIAEARGMDSAGTANRSVTVAAAAKLRMEAAKAMLKSSLVAPDTPWLRFPTQIGSFNSKNSKRIRASPFTDEH